MNDISLKFNYGSMQNLLDDFSKYNNVEYPIDETGRLAAINTLIELIQHYHGNKGYVITKEFVVTADYSPKMLPKRYDYGIAYEMVFTLNIHGNPFQTVQDVKYEGDTYLVKTKDLTLVFPVRGTLTGKSCSEVKDDDNGEQTEGDMAHDEEEVLQPEEQGLPPLREEGHPRVSRVARL